MIINYSATTMVKEEKQVEIKDVQHCFLKGEVQNSNTPSHFGVWVDEYGNLKSVTVSRSKQNVIKQQLFPSVNDSKRVIESIVEFLQSTTDVVEISEDAFFVELSRNMDMLGR